MDLFQKCKELYEKIRYFEYGIPVDGVIKPVPSPEYFAKNYHFLKPEEFEKYKGGICWDYVEYERKCLEVNDIDFNQYYLITNTPPNYDTHTFITVKDGDELIYIESSFKRVEHIIDGVQKFKSLEDIVRLITTNMWYCNDNDKHFDEFKYDVCKFKGHPQYGCTCEEYMKWMDDNSDIVIQDVSINPKKINNDELAVEEFTVNKVDTKFTQFVCESVNDPEEYDETLHDHIDDEDDVYNESWTDFKNGVHPSSGLMFHVSLKNDMDGKTITPQLPSYITDGGKLDDNYQEDTKTKRLCVSPSIEGCLIAILSYNKIREHVGDKFYVYTPEKPFSQYKHKTNKEIVKDKLVFDANITKEAWILEPCKLKLYGIIKLKKVKDLKKKPTVEKGIKMNTIKLDYEWIMTPKASGKFNKAIGDSPDKEDDTKEKPIKEYDNILVPNDEFFTEAKSFKQTIREEQTKNTRVSNVNSESKFKTIFKDYLSNIDVPSYPNTIQFKNPDKIDKNVISSKKFDIDTYRSAFTHLKSLYNKLLSAIKNNDLVHSKSYRNKIGELIGRSIENNTIFIDINEGNIEINIGAKTFRKLDSSKYDLFVHRSNNPNLSSIKPTIGTVSGTGIFMYKSSVVYMFAFEKTSDVNKRKKQFEIFDHYISSSYGDNLYLYKPTSSNVFCIDDNLMKRPGLPFNASMIPVNIETKNPLPVTKISESELKKLLNIEDDTKEKPIKEYDNILVSNDEFFMEVSKYERRLERQFQRDYERRPKLAIKDYTDKEDKNDKYKRESVNNRVRTLKDINEKQHRRNAPVKTRESKNKNKIKALKLLDYDPKTNTIKGNITLPDGSKKERVPYIIENNLARQTGPFVTEIDGFRNMVTYCVDEDELGKTEKARIQKVNEALDKFEANGERFIIVIPRRFLNQKQLSGLGASLHELGHFTYIHQPDDAEAERARSQSGSVKDKLTEGSPAYSHIIKNPLVDMQNTYGIDESNEFSADKYAADRIGLRNYEKMLKKLFQFGKKSIKKQVAEQVDAINNQIKDLLNAESRKNSIKFSKEVKQIAKESADTFANWANNAQVCIINEKSTIKDLDKKIADVNKKLKEFSKRSNDISKEFKDLSKELEKYNSERDIHVSNLKAQRNSAKMNSAYAQRFADAFLLLNRFKNLQSQLEGFKKWTKDYDVEMDARINYIRKYYEKKNIGESCLIMDNEEFFMEANKNLVKSLKILDYDPKTKNYQM